MVMVCTNNVRSLSRALNIFFLSFIIQACGGGGGGSLVDPTPTPGASAPTPTPAITGTPIPNPTGDFTISGNITFDMIPHLSNGGLDYNNINVSPIRGATVQLLNSDNTVVAQTSSDAMGNYSLGVTMNTNVRVRVLAALQRFGSGPSWDFRVTDNTQGNALYAMDGGLQSSGTSGSTRNLHASSGWDGASYSGERVSAPFAILDAVYEAVQTVLDVAPQTDFVASELRWSVNNIAVSGNLEQGLIGTSFYSTNLNSMYILGDENNDTDEHDKSVIQHEWGHYLEDNLSRSDSIGGMHTFNDSLDMRLVFGEGFANAFSGIVSNQEFYSDSRGNSQQLGFRFSLEENTFNNNPNAPPGWFNENSIGKIVFDLADANDDGVDSLSLGFGPIYQALSSSEYINNSALTSIYLFIETLKSNSDANVQAAIDTLVQNEQIFGTDRYGTNETNDGPGVMSLVLPIYSVLTVGSTINVCTNNRQNEFNGVDVRRFIRVEIPSAGIYRFSAETTVGTGNRNPTMRLIRNGNFVGIFNNSTSSSEAGNVSLSAGEHIIEVFDELNVDGDDGGGSACFDIRVANA
ncbi:hypothetical protein [Agarilytica rhodophyticola]|uniref:hypothetical protein n=1 Tax=Agarilytica rhodophyticola TaxID=1737490 RepID=UPI000B347FCF|nr:hypothetical protein [Agarilytica rhodophyticola]